MMAGDWAWPPVLTVAVPAAGGLLVGLLKRVALTDGRAHGPPDVIEVAQTGHGEVRARDGVPSALGALVSLGSGASVGQYGPLVHLGATIGSVIGRHAPYGGRTLGTIGIGCGVASAISTAFNAPIAGILFAHEVILRHYSLRAFAPITVASTIGFVLANFAFETRPLFRIDEAPRVIPVEFAGFVAIGLAGALVAIVFMRAIVAMGALAARSRLPVPLQPAVGGALMGILALWTPEIIGIGQETLRFAIIPDAFTASELGVLLAAKILATALCLGFGFVGGSFSPALVIGALFGALMAQAAIVLLPGAADSTGVYTICGIAAVTSPVIGGPITTILIVFELTRNYELTTAVMVSVVFANLVCYRLYGRSMYDETLRSRGCDLTLGRDQLVLDRAPIGPYVSRDYAVARSGESPGALRERLVRTGVSEAQLIDADGRYLGTITLNEVLAALDAGEVESVDTLASWDIAVLRADMSVLAALRRAESDESGILPVLESADSDRLVGVIAQSTIVRAYRETLGEIRREEHAAP
ncbi:MAG: chloride channel protein [Halofilum sp. (in: g-proteobacteria)]|nr:chloride channel protein [Halofilum sp. (in: g-proteobacteria)]